MHINGYEFLELNPANLINTDKAVLVRIFGSAGGWEVQVGIPSTGIATVYYNTFGQACQAASEAVAALPEPVVNEFDEVEEGEEAEEPVGAIIEYRNQRLVGRISGESWGRGDY